MDSLKDKIEQTFDTSNIAGIKLFQDGSFETKPIFNNDGSIYYSCEEIEAFDKRLLTLTKKLYEADVPSLDALYCLMEIGEIWDDPRSHYKYHPELESIERWDGITIKNDKPVVTKAYWRGVEIDGLILITGTSRAYKESAIWPELEVKYPGIEKAYLIATSLGLNTKEVARYCFEQVYSTSKPDADISNPPEDLAM